MVPPKANRTKHDISRAVADAMFSAQTAVGGRGTLADRLEVNPRTVDSAIAMRSLPEAQHIFNLLRIDPAALNGILASYGLQAVPLRGEAANDMHTIAGLSHVAGDWVQRLSDGRRCHIDTLALADAIRPLLTALTGIVVEADRIRGAA